MIADETRLLFGLCKVPVSEASRTNLSCFGVNALFKQRHWRALALRLLNWSFPSILFRNSCVPQWMRRFLHLNNLWCKLRLKRCRKSNSAKPSLIVLTTALRRRVGPPPRVSLSDNRLNVWIKFSFVLFWYWSSLFEVVSDCTHLP